MKKQNIKAVKMSADTRKLIVKGYKDMVKGINNQQALITGGLLAEFNEKKLNKDNILDGFVSSQLSELLQDTRNKGKGGLNGDEWARVSNTIRKQYQRAFAQALGVKEGDIKSAIKTSEGTVTFVCFTQKYKDSLLSDEDRKKKEEKAEARKENIDTTCLLHAALSRYTDNRTLETYRDLLTLLADDAASHKLDATIVSNQVGVQRTYLDKELEKELKAQAQA